MAGNPADSTGESPSARLTKGISRSPKGYIPTLDGWRAIAVSGVMLYHASAISFGPIHLRPIQDLGMYGVSLFFAISGLLICGRLLDEDKIIGEISLTGFYLRRFFRIQPPAFVYLVTLAILGASGVVPNTFWAWLSSLLSFRNFYTAAVGVLPADRYSHHFWSLAVEEHFYLFLPLLLVMAKRWRASVLASLTAVGIGWSFIVRHYYLTIHPAAGERSDLYAAALLFPALLAIAVRQVPFRELLARWTPILAILAIASFFLSALVLQNKLLWLIVIVGFPMIILSTALHPTALVSRVLESMPFRYIGRISYSLYLWQQLFVVNRAELALAGEHTRVFQWAPVNFVLVFVVATASYFLVEKPLIRVGARVASKWVSPRPVRDRV